MPDDPSVTQLLHAVQRGEPAAEDRLLHAVYAELHRLAAGMLAREPAACTVQATMLVHDAWLGLVGGDAVPTDFAHRRHFFGAAARAMRNLLVDHARRRRAERRGGDRMRVTFHDLAATDPDARDVQVLELHEALAELEARSPTIGRLVELRWFAGLTIDEVAVALERSPATVKREWTYARAWLHERLQRNRTAP